MLSEMVSLVMHLSLKLLVSLNTYLYTCCLPVYLVIFPVTFTHPLTSWVGGGREGGREDTQKKSGMLQFAADSYMYTLHPSEKSVWKFFSALKVAATWCVK